MSGCDGLRWVAMGCDGLIWVALVGVTQKKYVIGEWNFNLKLLGNDTVQKWWFCRDTDERIRPENAYGNSNI